MNISNNGTPRESETASSSASDSSDEIDSVSIATRLEDILSNIEYSGSFLAAQSSQLGVNPGLHIPGVGRIRLPLSPDDAKAIIKSCHASPFGKGSETVVDDSVRKSWELNIDQFSIENSSWKHEIQRLVGLAIDGLGLFARPADIVADRYKLLLYEEGAFFLPHQDSPKAEGMFGTLVICLPSEHAGGELVASHKGAREVFKTSPSSKFGYSSAAWYSDVTHEVKPVTSGYRLVLTYNLIHRPTAALLGVRENITAKILSVFNNWEKACKAEYSMSPNELDWVESPLCPPSLLYMLDYRYHSAGLNFTQLKGVDQMMVGELRKACKEKGFNLYLANVTKTVCGQADDDFGGFYSSGSLHTIVDEDEETFSLSTVVDFEGHVIAEDVSVDKSLFIQENFFGDEPDDEEFEGFTGNEGATATHFYRQTALLIIPPAFQTAFVVHALKDGKVNLNHFMRQQFNTVFKQPNNNQAREGLIRIARAVIAGKVSYRFNSIAKAEDFKLLGLVLVKIGELKLYKELVDSQRENVDPSTGRSIGKAIQIHGFSELHPLLDSIFSSRAGTVNQLELLSNIVTEYLKRNGQSESDPSDQMMEWHDATLGRILSCPRALSEGDGSKLVHLIQGYPTGNILGRVLPLVEKSVSESDFIVAFLTSLCWASKDGKLEKAEVSEIFTFALPKLLQGFRLERQSRGIDSGQPGSYTLTSHRISEQPNPLSPLNLIQLIRQYDALSIDRDALLDTLGKRSAALPERDVKDSFEAVLLPFIHKLCPYLHQLSIHRPLKDLERDFVSQTIETYFRRHVKTKPQPPVNWTRSISVRHCDCNDCRRLLTFLRDPHKETEEFTMASYRREHLQDQLRSGFFKMGVIKYGSPHILRVTKTKIEFEQEYQKWHARLRSAQLWLTRLVQEAQLVKVIGDESYQKLLQLSQTGVLAQESEPPPSTTAQSLNVDAPTATVPRKRSFVDLTS